MPADLTAQEAAIADALRDCPESILSREFPRDGELTTASVADLLGLHPAAARRILRRALKKITLAIGSDPAFCALVADYYQVEAKTTTQQ